VTVEQKLLVETQLSRKVAIWGVLYESHDMCDMFDMYNMYYQTVLTQ
jgi:hypothetical protein